MSQSAYELFELYFKYHNDLEGNLNLEDGNFQVTVEKVAWLDVLWSVVMTAESAVIVENAIELLSQCHLEYDAEMVPWETREKN